MSGKYMRGALVEFMPTFLVPLPNVIVFQYNPETMTHAWTQAEAADTASEKGGNPLAVKGMPGESFSFSIALDASDQIADGSAPTAALAKVSGVYSRIAALEMLMYPTGAAGGLLGTVSAAIGGVGAVIGAAVAEVKRVVPASTVPTVLFVWGPGRIVPVRVTSLSISEKLYDPFLNPTHAEATLGLRVVTPEELHAADDLLSGVAKVAYNYTFALRQALAVANLANAAESIVGMLPT